MNRIYLDYNASTPVDPSVLDAMLPYLRENFGNASSIHTFGQKARSAVETAREQVAALIGAKPQEIVFTSGGTESDNHAIFGSFAASQEVGAAGANIISTLTEHEAVLNACQELERRGASVTYLPVDHNGRISLSDLQAAIRSETSLITVMHANNELGTIQPLAAIGQIAGELGVAVHTDAVQSAGKIPIDVRARRRGLVHSRTHPGSPIPLRRTSPARGASRHGKCRGHRRPWRSRRTRARDSASGIGTRRCPARHARIRPPCQNSAITRQCRRPMRSGHGHHTFAEHQQHCFPRCRRRSPTHRTRSPGHRLLDRCRLLERRRRTIARPDRHRS